MRYRQAWTVRIAALGSRCSKGCSRHAMRATQSHGCFLAHASKVAKEGPRTFQKRRFVFETAELGPAGRRSGEVPAGILVRSRVSAAASSACAAGLIPLHLDRMLQQVCNRPWRWQLALVLDDEVWHAADDSQCNAAPDSPLCNWEH